ncbi:hypothetical protein [Peribacillus asahii]|uniref:hypothetical protein n=1 Tax=Peribacillus asahii TaxID=228899 RepID=UPI003813F3D8
MEIVVYQNECYKVVHRYESGYWEINKVNEKNNNNVILVNSIELQAASDEEAETKN